MAKKLYYRTKVAGGAKKAFEIMKNAYGENVEFTKKQFDSVCKRTGASCLDTLINYGFVKQVRVETFTKTFDQPKTREILIDRNGIKIMNESEWWHMPWQKREKIINANGGQKLGTNYEQYSSIECKRFYYQFDIEKLENFSSETARLYQDEIVQKLIKAKAEIARLETLLIV